MKRVFKNTLAALIAATTLTVGVGSINANAEVSTSAPWSASHVNVYGAPSSASTSPVVIIKQREVATAVCNSVSHSNTSAYTGYTYIDCVSHTMQQVTIKNTDLKECKPDVGSPLIDIEVQYKVSATTTSSSDVFWSYGTISKKSN